MRINSKDIKNQIIEYYNEINGFSPLKKDIKVLDMSNNTFTVEINGCTSTFEYQANITVTPIEEEHII